MGFLDMFKSADEKAYEKAQATKVRASVIEDDIPDMPEPSQDDDAMKRFTKLGKDQELAPPPKDENGDDPLYPIDHGAIRYPSKQEAAEIAAKNASKAKAVSAAYSDATDVGIGETTAQSIETAIDKKPTQAELEKKRNQRDLSFDEMASGRRREPEITPETSAEPEPTEDEPTEPETPTEEVAEPESSAAPEVTDEPAPADNEPSIADLRKQRRRKLPGSTTPQPAEKPAEPAPKAKTPVAETMVPPKMKAPVEPKAADLSVLEFGEKLKIGDTCALKLYTAASKTHSAAALCYKTNDQRYIPLGEAIVSGIYNTDDLRNETASIEVVLFQLSETKACEAYLADPSKGLFGALLCVTRAYLDEHEELQTFAAPSDPEPTSEEPKNPEPVSEKEPASPESANDEPAPAPFIPEQPSPAPVEEEEVKIYTPDIAASAEAESPAPAEPEPEPSEPNDPEPSASVEPETSEPEDPEPTPTETAEPTPAPQPATPVAPAAQPKRRSGRPGHGRR